MDNNSFGYQSNNDQFDPGTPLTPPPPSPQDNAKGYAVASLVLGIASVCVGFLCCCLDFIAIVAAGILAVLAIVFAMLAKKRAEGQMPGKAKAGMILGIIGLVLCVLLVLLIIAVLSNIEAIEEFYRELGYEIDLDIYR